MLMVFIGLYLVLTLLVGWWASRHVKNTSDFVVAGRNMPMLVAASALFATWFGSETILGASSEFLEHGLLGVIEDPFGAAMCLVLVGVFYARPLYRLNLLTFNDFYRLRFGRRAEFISALFIVPSYFGWIAAQLVALAIILKALMGVPLFYGIAICAFVVVVYTYIGGMWAVSVTDSIQTVMILAGLLYLAFILLRAVGGIEQVLASTPEGFFRFTPRWNWLSGLEYLAAWITIGLGSIPQQDVFQRVMSARNERTAVEASVVSGLMYLTIGLIPLLIGLCGKLLYPDSLDGDTQLVIPMMVMREGNLWLQTLFFGALLSAILSTTSGAILAPATVIGENLIKPRLPGLSDQRLLRIMRLAVVGVALCAALLAGVKADIYELVAQSSSLSLVSLFVPLTAGLFWPGASRTGGLASMLVGMGCWLVLELFIHPEVPTLLWGLGASLLAMVIGSRLWPDASYTDFLEATASPGP